MALHPRLGDLSAVAALTADLLHMIIQMTRPHRMLPGWMSCTWNLYLQQRRLARAVLECSRAAQRKRETHKSKQTACTVTRLCFGESQT